MVLLLSLLMTISAGTVSATEALKEETKGTTGQGAQVRAYYDICKSIPHYDDCNSLQGMAVLGDYIYSAKKNSGDNKGTVFRTDRFTGANVHMTIDGEKTVTYLGHANDMCAAQIGGKGYLFVTSLKKSVEALAVFQISDTKLSLLGIYNIYTGGGSNLTVSGVDVYSVEGNTVTLLLAQGDLVFMGTIDVTQPAGNVYCPLGFQVDRNDMLEVAREACGNSELEMTIQGSGFYNDTYYMPLTLHHNHSTQIKADNHADSTSVIVAFPNVADAISVMDRSVKASLSETIYIPDGGEMFFEVESVDFIDGMMYFSTNRVRIDHSVTTVSVLLDPGVDNGIFNRRASFHQDGLYMLAGANATDHYLYDPGAEDKHIEGGKYSPGINTYFGLESNEEGFYYIRSMLTKEYLTVGSDGTVTKSAKKENDPSQLFCLTQINWPNEPGHVAIISLLNYQYLNNESGTTKVITTTGGKSYRLKAVKDTATLETYLFDYKLYTACYPEETAGMTEAQAKEHFTSTGKDKGYIASIFFDPQYYLDNNPDVAAHSTYGTYRGAYTHFVEFGFWEGRQGSLFFSINEYLHSGNDKLKGGNYPDKLFYIRHFKQYGANESLTRSDRYGSDEFAVQKVVEEFGLTPTSGYNFLVDYISRNVKLSRVTTQAQLEDLLFDWQYYSAKYATALSEEKLTNFAGTTYAEKLYTHWIQYGIEEGRTASPYFDQAYYRQIYSDGGTTNAEAYTHFVTVGFWEGRKGSSYYDGGGYLYGLNPECQRLCPHNTPVTATQEPTCTTDGSLTTYCCDCASVLGITVLPKTGHSTIIDKAVEPTESKTGLTQGSHCEICGLVLVEQQPIPASGDNRRTYYDLCENIPTVEGCYAMQGMALLDDYIYTVKIASNNTKAVLFRTHRLTGETEQMTVDGNVTTTDLHHANDMCAVTVDGKDYLFVVTLRNGDRGMVAYEIRGKELKTFGTYGLYTANGSAYTASGVNVYNVDGSKVELLITSGDTSYLGTVDMTAPGGKLTCDFAFRLDKLLEDAMAVSGMTDISITVQGSCYADGVFYMPIGMGHSAITADNHGDSDYVFLLYPNIDEAIKNKVTNVRASIEDSIFIPDSGESFFEPETIAVANGVIYFNTNRIFLDRTVSSVSFLADWDSQTELLGKRAAYSQDGLYILRGAKSTEFIMVDPGASDTHLTTQKVTPDESAYFGFESNENGYYYIRSHRSGLYLTVNADHSVTQSKKKTNDPSQLWCIKQVDWPNDPEHVAIVSMLNYEYLNVDSTTMTVITTASGKTFRLDAFKDRDYLETYLFDYNLYTACNPKETAGMTAEEAKSHWLTIGRKKGYVASIFFDPAYYLSNEADVAATYGANNYEGAYEHFVTVGFWEGRQGSLFFDCKDYINYVNFKYDKSYYPNKVNFLSHYYRYGANESFARDDVTRRGAEEFDLKKIATAYGRTDMTGYDFLVHYVSSCVRLSRVETREDLENLLFDWRYYAAKYPTLTEAKVALLPGETYAEKLRSHWIRYGIKEDRTASAFFDPVVYRAGCPEVGTEAGEAYEHFVAMGFWAGERGSYLYDGETYIIGSNPLRQEVCDHLAKVTATEEATCISVGEMMTYCCFCSSVTKSETIPAAGHTVVTDKAIAPTCTATGLTEGAHCSVCNEVLTPRQVVPTTGHTEVIDEGVAPTCTATGLTEGKHCSVCKTILIPQEVISTTEHSYKADITEATCTTPGLVIYTCVCGDSYTEDLAIVPHKTTYIPMIPPTCSQPGQKEHYLCDRCGMIFADEACEYPLPEWYLPIESFGHLCQHVVTEPTCTKKGFTTYICACGESYISDEVDALGHSSIYAPKDGQAHMVTCENCDLDEEAPHSYENGLCICGHAEVKEPVLESTWKLGHSLNLASDISVNYAIQRKTLEGYDLDSVYILAEIDSYKEGKYSLKEVKLLPVVNGSYYYFTLSGLTAVNMNDEIRAVLYGTKDGQVHCSPMDTYSVATYAYAQLGKATAAQKLKVLCAELLRYGGKAQIFKSYRLDALVDAKMTEEQKALLSDMEAVTFGNVNLTENIPATNSITWLGKSLDLASKVSVKFIFSLGSYTGSTEDLIMKVTYKDINGKDKEKIITDLEIYNASRGYYAFTLDSLLAAELRSVLTVQILSGDTVVSGTLQYASDTYGNGKTGTLGDLCKALFAYSDSAKAYFS